MTNQFAQDSAALYHLFLVAFNASPGSKYWAQLQALDASGLSGVKVIDAMIKDPNLSKAFPADQSNAAFAQQIGNDLIGELASESAKATAIQLIENALEQTLTRPQVLDALAQYLGTLPTKPTQNGFDPSNPYLRVAQSLQKKTVVAQYFTEVMPFQGDDLAKLRDSVSRINDQSDVSSIAGIERLIRGFDQSREYDSYQTFVLAFSAAPGNRLLGLIRDEVSNGLSDAEIIDKLLLDPVTSKLYGTNDSSAVFATKLVSQFMRESDPLQLKAGAIDLISQVLQAGWTRGMVIEALAKYLRDIPASPDETGYQANDPLTKIALRLDNKALGAKIYTDFLGADASDITTLRAVLDRIDEQSDLSTPQTIRALMAQSETGRLQDGYIQGATVFADTDNDGVLDPGEQSTVTDAQGNFKLEGAIGNLVAFGGVDIATQLPFSSVYRAPLGSTIINPLTTLVSSLTDTGQTPDAAQALVAKQLGLPASLKLGRYDPLAILADSSSSTGQRSDAADVFKASAMVANAIVQATGAVGSISAADDSDVSKAAAKVLSGFFDGTEKLVDLAQTETLTKLLINTASAMGDAAKLTGVAAELAQVMQASNREIQKVTSNNASAGAIAESIIKAQKVAQGQATNEIEKAVSSGSSTALVANYTGAALVDRIRDTEIGTIGNGLVGTRSNLAPLASNLSSAETYTEDTALNLIDIVVADTDSANITATLTLSSAAAGSLSVASSGSVTSSFNSATGVWSASGALASVNALLAGLVFTPAANANGNFSMTTSISDGVNSPITGSKPFTGTALNDAPVLDASQSPSLGSVAQSAATPSGAVGVLVSSLLSGVSDPDAGAQRGLAITATQSTGGTLYYSLNNGVAWSSVGAVNESAALLLPADTNTRLYYQPNAGASLGTIDNALSFRAWDQSAPASGAGTKANLSVTGGASAYSSVTDTVSVTVVGAPRLNANPLDGVANLDVTSNLVLSFSEEVELVAGGQIKIINDANDEAGATTDKKGYYGEALTNSFIFDIPAGFSGLTLSTAQGSLTLSGNQLIINPSRDLDFSNNYHIEISGAALRGKVSELNFAGISNATDLNFSTVTPSAAKNLSDTQGLSQTMSSSGNLENSFYWFDIDGWGTRSSSSGVAVDLSGKKVALIAPDKLAAPSELVPDGNGGYSVAQANVSTGNFNLAVSDFGSDDLFYVDDLGRNPTENFAQTTELIFAIQRNTSTSTNSTAIFFDPIDSTVLGGQVTFIGQQFVSPETWMQQLQGSMRPFVFGSSPSQTMATDRAPTITGLNGSLTPAEQAGAMVIDADVALVEPDATGFGGGSLTVSVASPHAGDQLSLASGIAHASGAIQRSGTSVQQSTGSAWTTIGTIDSTSSGVNGAALKISFNAGVTDAQATAVARAITYASTTDAPPSGARSISYAVVSADGGTAVTDAGASVTITAANDAPVLDASQSPSLGSVAQSAATPSGAVGVLVSSLLSGVSDPDAGAQRGLAITATQSTGGTLYYSLNNGVAWSSVGAVNESAALLLPADTNTRLYYQPNAGASLGTINNALSFRAWDQSAPASGAGTKANLSVTGGASAYSSVTDTVSVTVVGTGNSPSIQALSVSALKSGVAVTYGFSSTQTQTASSYQLMIYPSDIDGSYSLAWSAAGASLSNWTNLDNASDFIGQDIRAGSQVVDGWSVGGYDGQAGNGAVALDSVRVTLVYDRLNSTILQPDVYAIEPYNALNDYIVALSANGNTFSPALRYGTTGNDQIVGTTSSDTIVAFSGDDLITPGPGADGVILGRGIKTIQYAQGDAGFFQPYVSGSITVSPNSWISTTGFDVISGFGLISEQNGSGSDVLDLPNGNYSLAGDYPSKASLISTNGNLSLGDFQWIQVKGNYDPILDSFKASDTGKSTLLIYDAGSTSNPEAIVLVGFVGSLVDDGVLGQLRPAG